jgi:hypothetical protein
MSRDTRIGLAGLLVACFAIAAFYLWPDKKWIGSWALVCASALIVLWAMLEIRVIVGKKSGSIREKEIEAIVADSDYKKERRTVKNANASTTLELSVQRSIGGMPLPGVAASHGQFAGNLEMVVTRGPRIEIRFNPNIQPYHFLESPHDTTHYRMGVYNDGPGTADNLEVRLVKITPRPLDMSFRADFPYAVRWALGNVIDNISYRLNAKTELHYELLSWWVSSDQRLIVDGIDTKQAASRDSRFQIEEGESWRVDYEIAWANAAPEKVSFVVRREAKTILMSRL